MFLKKKEPVPAWAGSLGKKEYPLFIKALEDYFQQKGEPFELQDGVVKLKNSDFSFGLSNLVQICAQVQPREYADIMARHFNLLLESKEFETQFQKRIADFEYVKPYLAVRLYDWEYLQAAGGDTFLHRPVAGELYAALVWDFPTAIQNVKRDEIAQWGKTEEELFAIGMDNIRQAYSMQPEEIDIGEDTLFGFGYEHFFVPNILFDLEKNPAFVGKGGAIVAAPTRSFAMIYPIHSLKVASALNTFFTNVPRLHAQGPGSLTAEIYWYRNGQFEVLNYEVGEKISFTPSEEFLALLNGGLD
ncbi:hypothetical protein LJC07_01680 [Christensenellaceae bacterium OttesenSCG-928-L17]|nr:hypothetical protein [Christensenellaceae bacterium OttesenSCG-928-L17]